MVVRWWLVVVRWWLVVVRWWLVVGGCSLVVGGWWLVVGGWWLVVGGWWLVVGGCNALGPCRCFAPLVFLGKSFIGKGFAIITEKNLKGCTPPPPPVFGEKRGGGGGGGYNFFLSFCKVIVFWKCFIICIKTIENQWKSMKIDLT